MSKQASMKNGSITSWFKPKTTQALESTPQATLEPPSKKVRLSSGDERWPSPSPTPTPSPPAVVGSAEQPQASPRIIDANASFASVQSTSSKRMVTSSGQEVVRGSDTETDDDLEDLQTILNKSRSKPIISASTIASSTTHTRDRIAAKSKVQKRPEKDYGAFSLSNLVEANKRQVAMETRIAAAQANLAEVAIESTGFAGSPKKEKIKAVLIETRDVEDGGKARRVMDALERTEVFERSDVWHFFDMQQAAVSLPKNPFPLISTPMLKTMLNDPDRRRNAFTSGFMQRIAQKFPLPDELMLWIFAEVCRETRDDLLEAYVETLQHCLPAVSQCLSPEHLLQCFRALGAKTEALDFQGPIQQGRESLKSSTHSLSPNLLPFIGLLGRMSDRLPQASKDVAVHFLMRACFDETVLSIDAIRMCIEYNLKVLLEAYAAGPELNAAFARLTNAIYVSINSPTLRQKLVSVLPSSSLVVHNFRRRLALAFVLDKSRYLDGSLENPALTARLLLLFEKGAALRITPDTDYVALRAQLGLLNIALDAGFSDFEFRETEDARAEKKFNENIDALTNAVRELSARIVDAGAAHMSRTEAKVTAEIVAQRLEFQVRTRDKPPKDWFGEAERREGEDFMRGFLKKENKQIAKGEAKQDDSRLSNTQQDAVQNEDHKTKSATKVKTIQPPHITVVEEPKFDTQDSHRSATKDPVTPTKSGRKDSSSTPATAERKIPIRSSTISPGVRKGKNSMVMMRFL